MSDYCEKNLTETLRLLQTPAPTLILFHRSPDADAVGSAFALSMVMRAWGSETYCVCSDEVPERLRFLMQGKQDSVLSDSIPKKMENARVISVDTASPAQLGTLYEIFEDRVDLMIDHHGMGVVYADHYICPNAAATGEILFDLFSEAEKAGKAVITKEIAIDLYAAINADTGSFRYSNTTAETHLRAADLLTRGVDPAEVNHKLYESRSLKQITAEAAAIQNLHVFRDGKVAMVFFPYALKCELELSDEHLETLVDIPRCISGVEVAFSIRQPEKDGIYRVSARSSTDFDVSVLCAKFGGGGHKKASGCTISASSVEECADLILNEIHF